MLHFDTFKNKNLIKYLWFILFLLNWQEQLTRTSFHFFLF